MLKQKRHHAHLLLKPLHWLLNAQKEAIGLARIHQCPCDLSPSVRITGQTSSSAPTPHAAWLQPPCFAFSTQNPYPGRALALTFLLPETLTAPHNPIPTSLPATSPLTSLRYFLAVHPPPGVVDVSCQWLLDVLLLWRIALD